MVTGLNLNLLYLGPDRVDKERDREMRRLFKYALWREINVKYPVSRNLDHA
jgi:hypothetical protein